MEENERKMEGWDRRRGELQYTVAFNSLVTTTCCSIDQFLEIFKKIILKMIVKSMKLITVSRLMIKIRQENKNTSTKKLSDPCYRTANDHFVQNKMKMSKIMLI